MPFQNPAAHSFNANVIPRFAPELPGVYGLSNAREWIYIGSTDDIQAALLAHLASNSAAVRAATGFSFEVCTGTQHVRQARLVQEYRPICDRL